MFFHDIQIKPVEAATSLNGCPGSRVGLTLFHSANHLFSGVILSRIIWIARMLMVLSIMFHWYIAPSGREGSNRLNIIFFEQFYMTLTLMSLFLTWHLSTRIISTGTLPSRCNYPDSLDNFAVYRTRCVCRWLFLSLDRNSDKHDEVLDNKTKYFRLCLSDEVWAWERADR